MRNNVFLLVLLSINLEATAQTLEPDFKDTSKWRLVSRTAQLIHENGKNAVRLSEADRDGLMILKDFEFSDGTIELDIKGRNIPQQSFVGIAFHLQDTNTFDAIYFRPFNFANTDTARRSRAVQYVSMPNYPWEKLRKEFPGKYENKVSPVPNADEWFHAKIVVEGKQIKVFVNDAAKPSLEVEKLTATTKGALALWVGFKSNGTFANLKITPKETNNAAIPYGNNPSAGKYFNAGDAKLYYEIYGKGNPILMLHGGVYGYISEFQNFIPKLAENHQVICLATRGHGKSEIGKQAYTFKQRAEDAYKLLQHLNIDKATVIGFSDGAYAGFKMAAIYPETVTRLIAMGAGDRRKDPSKKASSYSEQELMKTAGDYFTGLRKLMPEPERWDESLKMLNKLYDNEVISSETFQKIKCPVLVMAGDRDEYASVDKIVSCYKQIPNAGLSVIPGCGHVIFFCNFPAVWESMKGFLDNSKLAAK